MILQGNQRGGAKDLALHLLKEENEHVDVHELRGFVADDLQGALHEAYAVSRGTRCQQFLFSLSLNPPREAKASIQDFEAAIAKVEAKLGLTGQPRAIVFHEKDGRRHCHAVWSRIKLDEMKAVQLSHSKRKLMDVSRSLYIEHGWQMPRGMLDPAQRKSTNFSLEEWQQAKRAGKDARAIKEVMQQCWAASDSRAAFAAALDERGYKLAKGDRRGFVAVDWQGEVYAIAKWAGIKTKDVRARLGNCDDLHSVADRKEEFASAMAKRLHELEEEQDRLAELERLRAEQKRKAMVERQRARRIELKARQALRHRRETAQRQARYNKGLRGLLDRLSGARSRIKAQNETETLAAKRRDAAEKDAMIFEQITERRDLGATSFEQQARHKVLSAELSGDAARFEKMKTEARREALESVRKRRTATSERRPRRRRSRGPEPGL